MKYYEMEIILALLRLEIKINEMAYRAHLGNFALAQSALLDYKA